MYIYIYINGYDVGFNDTVSLMLSKPIYRVILYVGLLLDYYFG